MTNRVSSMDRGDGAGAVHCAQCGKPMAVNAKFCGACGTPVPQRACEACGATNAPQAKFCAKCGQALIAPTAAPAAARPATVSGAPSSAAPVPVHSQTGPAAALPAGVDVAPSPDVVAPRAPPLPAPSPHLVPPRAHERVVERPSATSHAADEPSPSVALPLGSRTPSGGVTRPARGSRALLIGVGVLVVALLVGGGGYAYWTGIIGDRPGSVASEVTDELKAGGFDGVTVKMAKDWVATVTGTVVGQDQRQRLEEIVSGRSEVRRVDLTGLSVQPSLEEIEAAVLEALQQNGLGDIDAKIAEGGLVILTGRARDSSVIGRAGETVINVPGVADVDNRIAIPFSELQREVNDALRAGGHPRARVTVDAGGEVSVSGTLVAEGERSAVIERIVATAASLGETVDPSRVRDEMIVEKPVVVAPPPKQVRATATPTVPTAAFESTEPEPVRPPIVGTWSGQIRWGIVGSKAAFQIGDATVGGSVGRTEYSGSYLYCRGSLRLVEISGNEYTFDETITEKNPRATCPGGGTVTMVLSTDSAANVKWMRSNKLSAVRYKGTLNRQ